MFIANFLRSATNGYKRMIELELKGETPVNRPAHLGAKSRRVKKILAKSSWFKKKSANSTSGQPGKHKPKDPDPRNNPFCPLHQGFHTQKGDAKGGRPGQWQHEVWKS